MAAATTPGRSPTDTDSEENGQSHSHSAIDSDSDVHMAHQTSELESSVGASIGCVDDDGTDDHAVAACDPAHNSPVEVDSRVPSLQSQSDAIKPDKNPPTVHAASSEHASTDNDNDADADGDADVDVDARADPASHSQSVDLAAAFATISRLESIIGHRASSLAAAESALAKATSQASSERELAATIERDLIAQEEETEQIRQKLALAEAQIAQQADELTRLRQACELHSHSRPLDDRLNEEHARALEHAESDLASLRRTLAAERSTNSTLEDDLTSTESRLHQCEASLRTITEAEQHARQELESMRQQMRALEQEMDEMDKEINEKDQQIRATEAKLHEAMNRPADSNTQPAPVDSMSASPADLPLSSSSSSLPSSSALSTLTADLVESRHAALALEDQLRDIKYQLSTVESKEKKLLSTHATQLKKRDEKLAKVEQELKQSLIDSNALRTQVDTLETQLATRTSERDQLESRLAIAAADHANDMAAYQEKMRLSEAALFEDLSQSTRIKVEAMRQRHEEELAEAKAAAVNLEEVSLQLSHHQSLLASSESRVSDLTARCADLDSQLSESLASVANTLGSDDTLRALESLHAHEIAAMQKQIADITSGEDQLERARLEKELTSTKVILSAQIEQSTVDEARIRDLEHKLHLVDTARVELATKNADLTSEMGRVLLFAAELEQSAARDQVRLKEAIQAQHMLEREADGQVQNDMLQSDRNMQLEKELQTLQSLLATQMEQREEERDAAEAKINQLQSELADINRHHAELQLSHASTLHTLAECRAELASSAAALQSASASKGRQSRATTPAPNANTNNNTDTPLNGCVSASPHGSPPSTPMFSPAVSVSLVTPPPSRRLKPPSSLRSPAPTDSTPIRSPHTPTPIPIAAALRSPASADAVSFLRPPTLMVDSPATATVARPSTAGTSSKLPKFTPTRPNT